jgi:hypothetical protein
MISTLIQGSNSSFINLEKDLPVLMDGLWETWQVPGVDRHFLICIAGWLLKSGELWEFQDLLNAYDSYTCDSIHLMSSNALLFIEGALALSCEAAKASNSEWELHTRKLRNPWLVMHIHNIQQCDWCIPASTMREVMWGQCGLHDGRGRLDRLEQLDLLDLRDHCDLRDSYNQRDMSDLLNLLSFAGISRVFVQRLYVVHKLNIILLCI